MVQIRKLMLLLIKVENPAEISSAYNTGAR